MIEIIKCQCRACIDAEDEELSFFEKRSTTQMIVCRYCGNKRCPHANNHNNKCTASNAPGQTGSAYP